MQLAAGPDAPLLAFRPLPPTASQRPNSPLRSLGPCPGAYTLAHPTHWVEPLLQQQPHQLAVGDPRGPVQKGGTASAQSIPPHRKLHHVFQLAGPPKPSIDIGQAEVYAPDRRSPGSANRLSPERLRLRSRSSRHRRVSWRPGSSEPRLTLGRPPHSSRRSDWTRGRRKGRGDHAHGSFLVAVRDGCTGIRRNRAICQGQGRHVNQAWRSPRRQPTQGWTAPSCGV